LAQLDTLQVAHMSGPQLHSLDTNAAETTSDPCRDPEAEPAACFGPYLSVGRTE